VGIGRAAGAPIRSFARKHSRSNADQAKNRAVRAPDGTIEPAK
jgi:hypothetical protein